VGRAGHAKVVSNQRAAMSLSDITTDRSFGRAVVGSRGAVAHSPLVRRTPRTSDLAAHRLTVDDAILDGTQVVLRLAVTLRYPVTAPQVRLTRWCDVEPLRHR
jgi:hypothetical protein